MNTFVIFSGLLQQSYTRPDYLNNLNFRTLNYDKIQQNDRHGMGLLKNLRKASRVL